VLYLEVLFVIARERRKFSDLNYLHALLAVTRKERRRKRVDWLTEEEARRSIRTTVRIVDTKWWQSSRWEGESVTDIIWSSRFQGHDRAWRHRRWSDHHRSESDRGEQMKQCNEREMEKEETDGEENKTNMES
jgi:hypothetical protein